jgi:hypothetical protein
MLAAAQRARRAASISAGRASHNFLVEELVLLHISVTPLLSRIAPRDGNRDRRAWTAQFEHGQQRGRAAMMRP